MNRDSANEASNVPLADWPTEFWVIVVPGLMLLTGGGAIHFARRLEDVLRQMGIEAAMVSGPLQGMLVCAAFLLFLAFHGREVRAFTLQMLVWSILLLAASLLSDFLAAVAIQLFDPAASPLPSERIRQILQMALMVPYLVWTVARYRMLRVALGNSGK